MLLKAPEQNTFSFWCWYASVKLKKNYFIFENFKVYSKFLWLPSKSWSTFYKKNNYYSNNFFLKKIIFSLNLLFIFFFKDKIKFSYFSFPDKSFYTTVTRGPMVRKKKSREQIGLVYSLQQLNLFFNKFYSFFFFNSFSNVLYFSFYLELLCNNYLNFFDFILLQRLKITYNYNLTSFIVFV